MALRYLVSGGTGVWSSTTNWSATSGGASGASAPTVADDVIFNAASLNANIALTATAALLTLTCSGYTGTLGLATFNLQCSGNIVLSTGMLVTGTTGLFRFNTNSFSMRTNGVVIPNLLLFLTSGSWTMLDDWNISGTLQVSAASQVLNGTFNVYCSGINISAGNLSTGTGSQTIILNGTGTISTLNSATYWAVNTTINTIGTVTFSPILRFDLGIFTYTSGTVVTTGSTFFTGQNPTLNTNGIVFNILNTLTATQTITLTSKLTTGTLTVDSDITFTGAFAWECNAFNLGASSNLGRTITLLAGNTYKVNNDFNSIRSTNSLRSILQSSSGVSNAIFTCGPSCVMNVGYTNAIRIDSSLGKQVFSFNGVYTTAINWSNTFPVTVAYAYQS